MKKYIRMMYRIIETSKLESCDLWLLKENKVADTIEELCDEFVCENEHWVNHKYMSPEIEDCINYKDSCEKFSKTPTNLYGAIWTDKGLIYVAKMNDKGDLELL